MLRQLSRILSFGLYLLIVIAILLEILLRIYYSSYGTREQKIMYLYSLDEIRALDAKLVPMPYINYVPSPQNPEHNALGYRGPDVLIPKPEGTFRIVALGGSTTYSSATTSEESYPMQLWQILRDEYAYTHVEVVNAGVSGYTTWEILVNLVFRVLELEPDMIIFYEAVNDTVPREHTSADCYRGYNVLRGLNPARGFWIERDSPLSPSVLHRVIGINLGLMENPLTLDSHFETPQAGCAADSGDVWERAEANRPVYYERNLRNIIAIAQANGIIPVLSTWVFDPEGDRPEVWTLEIGEHNDIVRALAAEMGAPLYDLAAKFPHDRALWTDDAVHMTALGTHEQARQYAEFLVNEGLIPEPS